MTTLSPHKDRMRRLSKTDPIILRGGALLSFIAGFVNTISLGYFQVPISHMTGAVTRLSIDLATLNFSEFIQLSYIFFGFLLGAVVTGFLVGGDKIRLSIEYTQILLLESFVLFISFFLFKSQASFALFLVSFACGLQNAMASNYMGLIIRTTHVTGIVTDLGILVGKAFKNHSLERWKFGFLFTLLISFFLGGFCGISAYIYMGFFAIFIPIFLCSLTAISFYYMRVLKKPGLKV